MHDDIRNLYIKQLFEKYNIQTIPKLKDELRVLCKKGKFNVFLFMHLGDDFQRLGQLKEFERVNGATHFIIQPNEVFLMDMFQITDYTIFDLNRWFNENLPVICNNRYGEKEYFYHQLIENTISHYPQETEPFIVFQNDKTWKDYEERFGCIDNITSYTKAALGLFNNDKMNVKNLVIPNISTELAEKMKSIISIDKVVLFLPEARSDELLDKRIWNLLAKNIISEGYVIIENVVDKKNHVEGALNFDLSLADVIAIGMRCHSIISLRSGLCDIFSSRGRKLYVLWPKSRYECSESFFRFSSCYDLQENDLPQDFVLDSNNCQIIMWENKNIIDGIKKKWLPKTQKNTLMEKIIVLQKSKGSSYLFRQAFIKLKEKNGLR